MYKGYPNNQIIQVYAYRDNHEASRITKQCEAMYSTTSN